MDQEKIGKFIRELRKKNNLSQSEFADMLGVTFQAVSKWENGRNLPDMSILKEISSKFSVDIDEIINGEEKDNKKKRINILFLIIISLFLIILIIFILTRGNNGFLEFNEVKTSSSDFTINGSVVHTNDRTSLIINSVNYTGDEDNTIYKKLSCSLYEDKGSTKKMVSECDSGNNKTLTEYLKSLKIKMDHYSEKCTMFKDSDMYIELNLEIDDKTITYKIPLEITEEDCD